jgi:DNA repair exonuclease SbcCD nuclease subunit
VKIVVSGDWHIGLVVQGYDANPDIEEAAMEVVRAANDADMFVLPGDLFHSSRPRPKDYALAIRLLSMIEKPAVVLKGNHDETGGAEMDALGPLAEMRCWPQPSALVNGKVFVRGPWHSVEFGPVLSFMPYMNDVKAKGWEGGGKTAQEVVDRFFEEVPDGGIVFAHLDVDGAKVGTEGRHLRGKWLGMPESAHREGIRVVNGHLHQRQWFKNVVMPGSLLPTNMDEREDEKGYVVLEV